MKTGGEFLRVDSTPIAPDGTKLEPEERGATEAFMTPVEVTLDDHAVCPGDERETHGSMRGMVGAETTAGDVAQDASTRCELCEHWRHEDWRRHLSAISDTHEGATQIDALRGELLGRKETLSVDAKEIAEVNLTILHEFGICAAFTESTGMVTASPFYGGCPADDRRFKTRDLEAKRIGSDAYDRILRLAQGKEN